MNATPASQTLIEEYEIYVSMWNDARVIDGPNSPVTQFVRKLVEQTAADLAARLGQARLSKAATS